MPEFTIITTHGILRLPADRWTRTDAGDVFLYPDDQAGDDVAGDAVDPVAEVPTEEFVAIFRTDRGGFESPLPDLSAPSP